MKRSTIPAATAILLVALISLAGTISAQTRKRAGPGFNIDQFRKALHGRIVYHNGLSYTTSSAVAIELDSTGSVTRYYTRHTLFISSDSLDRAIRTTRFTPPVVNGVRRPSWIHLHFDFEISRKYRSGRFTVRDVNAGIGTVPQALADSLKSGAITQIRIKPRVKTIEMGKLNEVSFSLPKPKPEPAVEDTAAAAQGVFVSAEHLPDWDQEALQRSLVYPESARRDKVAGTVIVNVLVSSFGRPVRTIIDIHNAPALETSAIDAVMKTKFTPAVQNGKAIAYWVQVPVVFKLPTER